MYKNLRAFRESLGLSQKEFADSLGIKLTTYNGYETGFHDPKSDFWIEVAKTYHVSIDFLMGFEGNKKSPALSSEALRVARAFERLDSHGRRAVSAILDAEADRIGEAAPDRQDEPGTIRHYRYRPAAGVDGLIEGSDYDDLPRSPGIPANADYCLTVSGDSMEPYIHDGQMIFVERDAPLRDFDVGVFGVNGAVVVKQYCPGVGGQIYLLSANPARQDANITLYGSGDDSFTYYGRVILPKKLPRPKYK